MGRKRTVRIVLWFLALGWVAVLFVLSGQSGAASSELSRRFTRLALRLLPQLDISAGRLELLLRKLAHAGIFFVEGFLLGAAAAASFGRGRGFAFALLGCAAMAAANELHQAWSPGRSCEARDMLIDMGGALLGILLLLFIDKLSRPRVTNAR